MHTLSLFALSLAAALWAILAFSYMGKASRLERQLEVLWDQVGRYEAYVKARTEEDEARQRAAILN